MKMLNKEKKVKAIAINTDNGQIWVMVEGPDFSSVKGTDAKTVAIEAAAKAGYPRCGYNQETGPYVVDENGESAEADDDVEKMLKEAEIIKSGAYKYRNNIRLMQGGI